MAQRLEFEKDPNAVLEYELDLTNWLEKAETAVVGDTLNTVTWTPPSEPAGTPTVQSSTILTGNIARVWLVGGTLGQDYKFTVHIVSTAGRQDDRTVTFKIRTK